MTLGRMKGNTLTLDDASVSISHAKITRKGAEYFLKDLNSTNGTMLNGQSINEARLKDGDQIKFGEVIAIFRGEPPGVPVAPGTNPAPVAQPAPAPVPVTPACLATTLVLKSLVTPSAPASPNRSSRSSPAQTTHTSRSRNKPANWLVPAVGGGVVLLVVGLVVWKFFGDRSPKPVAESAPPAAVVVSSNQASGKLRPAAKAPGGESTAPKLVNLKKALTAVDPADRRRAAAGLHALGAGAKEALPDLRNALKDADADVRMWAALALINNKSFDKAAIPILVEVLHHSNSMLRQVACLSLALIPYDDTEKDVVVTALADTANKDEDDEVRKAALASLKIIAPEVLAGGR